MSITENNNTGKENKGSAQPYSPF